jgi:hypothetical protein
MMDGSTLPGKVHGDNFDKQYPAFQKKKCLHFVFQNDLWVFLLLVSIPPNKLPNLDSLR